MNIGHHNVHKTLQIIKKLSKPSYLITVFVKQNNFRNGVQTLKFDLTSGAGVKRSAGDPIIDSAKRIAYGAQSVVEPEIPQPMDP